MPKQQGRHYRFEKYEFWAERGMITLLDTEKAQDSSAAPEEYTWRIPPGEFMKRAIAARLHDPELYSDQTAALRRLLEEARIACKLAKQQGDPTDASTLEHVIKHQRKRQIVMPHELPSMPGAGPRYKIKPRGDSPGATLEKGADVVPRLFGS